MADNDVQQEIEALRADFGQLRTDLLTLTKSIGELSKRHAEDGVESLRQTGARAAERVRAAAADATAAKDAGLAAAEQHIAEHPISSLVVAFAAGMMLGKMATRR
jgi:ElaB/YqjD/DUF883 family membrane-anchored ribosome-binding protein